MMPRTGYPVHPGRLGQYALLWHAAIAQAHPAAHTILLLSIGPMTVLAMILGALDAGMSGVIGWALCMPAIIMLFAWTMCFVPGASGLNTPASAQLAPGMRARLFELTVLLWGGTMAVLTAGLLVLQDGPALMLLLAMAMTLGVAAGMGCVQGSWIMVLPLLGASLAGKLAPPWLLDALRSPAATAVVVAAMIPCAVLVARALLPQAGDRHWDMLAHRARMLGKGSKGFHFGGLAGFAWHGLTLGRDLARREPRALLMRALGPDIVAATMASATAAGLTFATLTYFGRSVTTAGVTEVLAPSASAMTALILLSFLFQAGSVPALVARSGSEQALLRLAPAMPAEAQRFNRMLAHGLLRQGLTIWACVSATAVLMALVAGARGNALAASACMCCMTLPAIALALRDHARAPSWSAIFYWLFAVGLSLIGPLVGAILFMSFSLPFWASATIAAIVVAGLLVYRRLRLMEGAPFAYPAGRLD